MQEKGNRKGKSQKSNRPQKGVVVNRREAVVYIRPDEDIKVEIKTRDVNDVEMVHFLRDMAKFFAENLVNDADEVVGSDPEAQEAYLDWRIKQAGLGE